jgi:lipoate-protein ligase A
VLGEKKIGGNAQTISKGRWVHHTSFLWDFTEKNMQYLKVREEIYWMICAVCIFLEEVPV